MTMTQTFDQRIADQNKTPLHYNFIRFIKYTASFNNKNYDEIWDLWQKYTKQCNCYDQSPTKAEFCKWNNLKCTDDILQLI